MVELIGSSWSVAEHDGAEIAFGAGGTVTGNAGVNRFRGQYTLAGDRLTVGALATTRMAGTPEAMQREQRLLRALAQPLQVGADGDSVVLDDGATVIRLVPFDEWRISGTVACRDPIVMPQDAAVTVTLSDVSRLDVAAPLLAEQVIEGASQVPVPFELRVLRRAVGPNAALAVQARITLGDTMLWISDASTPLPAAGSVAGMEIVVRPV